MQDTLWGFHADRLERSCRRRPDSIRFGTGARGLDREEVYLSSAFEPHRHDTYAIGITTVGVQTFRYRGSRRVCLPGQLHILHPDEAHDGAPGTEDGFGYRIMYLAPELIRQALDGDALPFVANAVQPPTSRTRHVASFLESIDEPISDLAGIEIAVAVADTLRTLSGRPDRRRVRIDNRAVELVRDYLTSNAREQTPAWTLERITGADRFTIARHFRRAFGTSPDRYRTMRRLVLAPNRSRERTTSRASCRRRWLRGPKPHDAPVQENLWPDARALGHGRCSRRLFQTMAPTRRARVVRRSANSR